jgi:hypothetical protein
MWICKDLDGDGGFGGGSGWEWSDRGWSRKSTLTQGFEKCPWRKLNKGSNGINILGKFYLNHGPQEPEIYSYIANIPGVSNMIRWSLMKINYTADHLWLTRGPPGVRGPRLGNTGLDNVGSLTPHNPTDLHGLLRGELFFCHVLAFFIFI